MVTWNRRELLQQALTAVCNQNADADLHVIITDNASTDDTTQALLDHWAPTARIDNPTNRAHLPAFTPLDHTPDPDSLPQDHPRRKLASLTVIRNHHNLGGCGGFNTCLAYTEHAFNPDFVWLVDDDIDLPTDALSHLLKTAADNPNTALVGSRTVDIQDRETTIESTIYFDDKHAVMHGFPAKHHRNYDAHRQWAADLGPACDTQHFTGNRDVDVVSACSMLARWPAVVGTADKPPVGFWDHRYFIYCDDADWCIRFRNAGWDVTLSLDAVVYHTPWHQKVTPMRLYYAQRNAVWMAQKALSGTRLKLATCRWLKRLVKDAAGAAFHRRLFHAEIIRQTCIDITRQRWRDRAPAAPPKEPLSGALKRTGLTHPSAHAVLLCTKQNSEKAAETIKNTAQNLLKTTPSKTPSAQNWQPVILNLLLDIPESDTERARRQREDHDDYIAELKAGKRPARKRPERPRKSPPPGAIVFGGKWPSRIKQNARYLFNPPTAAFVFDSENIFPLVRGKWNIHVDMRDLENNPEDPMVQVERDGLGPRLAFLARLAATLPRLAWHCLTVRPAEPGSKYGVPDGDRHE